MHAILAAALVFLVQSSVSAGANTVVFDYQGLPFGYEYTQGQKTKWAPCESGPYPDQCEDFNYQTWKGWFAIDEALYPGGMLANTTLTFQIFSADNFENDETMPCAFSPGLEYCYAYSVWNDSGVEWTGHTYEGWDAFGFFSYNELGFLEDFIGNTVYDGHFAWEFGSKGRIAGWGGSNMQGGDGDPASGGFHRGNWHGGDSQTSGPVTQGPGTWTRTPAAATVIPLPPASLGLAAGLGLVLLVRRQSRNRIA